ncbi:hypothetical protein [Nocardia iowensis]|uniref:Uncharacterized protein n=1 Tax=Nocardia iowensis TaxID=204891 RepID=A0ABX8RL07_NOCIO|nr:hypothetical protein [Nocardia iowensis]QXN90308.1 hypothetical protein KV110_33600 [Nocardia iowensis]
MIRRAVPDLGFARRVIDTIVALPDQARHPGLEWNQDVYRAVDIDAVIYADTGTPVCRTALCVAGWVVQLDPDVAWAYDSMTLRTAGLTDDTTQPPVQLAADLTTARDLTTGEQLPAREYAKRRLGLTELQAGQLFLGTNTLDDLTEIIEAIDKGRL